MITYQQLDGIRKANAKLSSDLRSKIVEVIERVGVENPDALKYAIVSELGPVMEMADSIAAEMAAALYNGWRYEALGLTTETVAEVAYDLGKIEAMANTAAKEARDGAAVERIEDIVFRRASYDMRKSYGDTMISNAGRDTHRVRFARIPGPSEHYAAGCPFCRMLASRGFVYWSKKTAGEFDHYHANCTCEVVAQFDNNPRVEGYDPGDYYEEYLEARRYAKDNLDAIRDRETVNEKEFARYKYGFQVGTRSERYKILENGSKRKSIQANDISAAYRDLGLAKKVKPGGVAAEIDKFVPCLEDAKTGEILPTTVSRMSSSELKGYNTKTGWGANWQSKAKTNEVFAIRVSGSDEIHGLIALKNDIDSKAVYVDYAKAAPHSDPTMTDEKRYNGIGGHLFAIAAGESVELGYGGTIHGFAANRKLLEHYIESLNASFLGALHPYHFMVFEDDAMAIIEQYNFERR